MQLETTRFGAIEVNNEETLVFTQPIIGFPEFRHFVLLPGPKDSGVTWLQSTDAGELAFLLMNPVQVAPDYHVAISQDELAELAATSVAGLEVYTLLVIPADPKQVRTNLKAPILINRKQRLAKQTVLERSDYPIQFFFAQAGKETAERQEVSHARSDA